MKYLFLLGCSLVVASPAVAQEEEETGGCCSFISERIRTDTITVVATGSSQQISESGQAISVIGGDEIESTQGPDLIRVLERLPSVNFSRNGPLGSSTSMFVRGANSEQLLVLVDGVRMADVAAPSGGFDFGTLLAGGIGRIELLRGSNSVVWGSDAIGGVLALTTRREAGLRAAVEYGANDSIDASADAGLKGDRYFLGVDGGYSRSNGISAYAPGTEDDGFRQWRIGGRGSFDLSDDLALVASARHADSRIEFDGYPPPNYDTFLDTLEYQTTRQTSGRTGIEYDGNALSLRGGVALSSTKRSYFDAAYGTASSFDTDGRSVRADLGGKADLGSGFTLNFGGDSEWTRFSTTYDPRQTARLTSGHALLGWSSDTLSLAAGGRLDDSDRFGSHWTFGANGAVKLGQDWRIKASYGEGFKAPTLYQLYGYGGNVDLAPEESRSYDFGVEKGDRNGGLHFAATLFQRDATNQIDYVWPAGYFNTRRTRATGLELEAGAKVTETLSLRAAYSHIKATNRISGNDLARRPRDLLSVSGDWETPLSGLTLGADLRVAGDSFDDGGNFTSLDGYGLVTLRAAMPLGEHFELFGRIENLTDQSYQTAAGYGTYGRSAYGGVRLKW